MDLLIDLGNSRLKWAQSGPGCWLPGAVLHAERAITDVLEDVWDELPAPARIVMTSVASEEVSGALEYWMQERWALRAHRVRAQAEQLGVMNKYRAPETLGADRWAALLGARGLTERACIVVDCGTAVTIDALSKDGVFAGGVILPGLRLSRHSLDRGTAGVEVGAGDDTSCLAQSTADAAAAGTLFGLAGAITRCLQEQERALEVELDILLTGGDAARLAPLLERPAVLVPDLVLKGLARVAEELVLV